MSVKWFRTSSSVLKSCCSMNHIYLHREPLSNAPASSNTFNIAQVASLVRKGFKASWICTRGERDKQWTSSCILCMLWKWFAIYGRKSFASTLQWAHKEQPTFILFYVLSRGLLGMLGRNSNRAKLICAESLLIFTVAHLRAQQKSRSMCSKSTSLWTRGKFLNFTHRRTKPDMRAT